MSDFQQKALKHLGLDSTNPNFSITDSDIYDLSNIQAGYDICQKEYEEKLRWIPVEEKLPELKETQYMVETTSKSGLRSYWIIDSQYDIDCLREFRVSWRHFL